MTALALKCCLFKALYPAVERSDRSNTMSTSGDGSAMTVKVPLMPAGGADRITVRAKARRTGSNPLTCSRPILLSWQDAVFGGQVTGVAVAETTPAAPDWTGTTVSGAFAGSLHAVAPDIQPHSTTPEISSPSQALWFTGWQSAYEVSNLAPGEKVSLHASYRQNLPVDYDSYFTTIALTMGVITDKIAHPSVPYAYVYYVVIEGEERGELYPTDFLEYSIGDRIAVIKETADSAALARPGGLIRPPPVADLANSVFRPAPLRFV